MLRADRSQVFPEAKASRLRLTVLSSEELAKKLRQEKRQARRASEEFLRKRILRWQLNVG